MEDKLIFNFIFLLKGEAGLQALLDSKTHVNSAFHLYCHIFIFIVTNRFSTPSNWYQFPPVLKLWVLSYPSPLQFLGNY